MPALRDVEAIGEDKRSGKDGRLILGDNLAAMEALIKEGLSGAVKLVYIDPPFLSNASYSRRIKDGAKKIKIPAYDDRWTRAGYLNMLAPRLAAIRRLLCDDGLAFTHCDWHVSHLVRALMDEVFGAENFLNEIIWHYGGRGAKAVSRQLPRNHDSIFVYGKTPSARLKKIRTEKVMSLKEAVASGFRKDAEGRVFKTAPRGDYTDESIKRLSRQGRIHRTKTGGVRIKYFLEKRGSLFIEEKLLGDVWDDIPDAMHMPLKERTGYPTQKPEALLRRIIEASTDKGDLVADFFSGSGTTASAAVGLKRRWIAVEASTPAIAASRTRLIKGGAAFLVQCLGKRRGEKAARIKRLGIKKNGSAGFSIEFKIPNTAAPVESVSIDANYDGHVFSPSHFTFMEDLARMGKTFSVKLSGRPEKIAVKVTDASGAEYFEEIK